MQFRAIVFALCVLTGVAVLCPGCSQEDTTTTIYVVPTDPSRFPGTPASASNLAADAKALSPGGQDVTAVRVFWEGHDRHRAVVLFESRAFLSEGSWQFHEPATATLPDRMTTETLRNYFRHVWATYFDGGRLSEPVELVGKNMDGIASVRSYVSVDEATLQTVDEGVREPWRNVVDTAVAVFYRPSAAGAFGAGPSSAKAAARDGDAVILFRARDVDTDPGVTPAGAPADNANERLYSFYFDASQAGVAWAQTADVVGSGASSTRIFRWGFQTQGLPVNAEAAFTTTGPTLANVSSFGILADGFLGQARFAPEAVDMDDAATYTHFLVAVWVEFTGGYATARGVFDRITGNGTPGNEYDMRLLAAVFDVENGVFGAPQEIEPDADAVENDPSTPSWVRSAGDTWVADQFITYDNQVFFTTVDAAMDNDPAAAPNWDHQANNEGLDSSVNWNRFQPSPGTTAGQGSFLGNALRLSPAHANAHLGVGLGAATNQNLPDVVNENVNEFNGENGTVVWGADEGLGATYVFFSHFRFARNVVFLNPSPPPPAIVVPGYIVDDADLFVAQLRHTETTPAAIFNAADDLLEVDTGGDAVPVTAETGATLSFSVAADPSDDDVVLGTGATGPVFNEWLMGLVTVGSGASAETRFVLRNLTGGVAPGSAAYRTYNGAAMYYDEDFTNTQTDQPATVEDIRRSVRDDWRVVLNATGSFFLALYRQQDPSNQSLGVYGGAVRSTSPDVGLFASRVTPARAGDAPQALAGQALVGASALRLDSDFSTTDPTSASQFREDAVAFQLQRDLEPAQRIQSHPDRVNVLYLTIEDDNPAFEDARNTPTGGHSTDILMAVQVENGPSALVKRPTGGAVEVARYPFGFLTADDDRATPANPGTEAQENFAERSSAHDAGVNGDAVVYYLKPTAPEIQVGGIYTLPSPAGMRLFAANFSGSTTLTTLPGRQLSSDAYDADLGAENRALHQALFYMPPTTRGLSATAACGRSQFVLWIEDRAASATFLSGGALMTLRYNKAVPEEGATAARDVTAADAFTPSITGSSGWPLQADFASGDSVSFPVGAGFDREDVALYFTQFGEVFYNEYSAAAGLWWQDAAGLPAPTLLSHEGFPNMPNAFIAAITGQVPECFGAQVFGNYVIQEFTATVAGSTVTQRRYDNRAKALAFYAKDDGGADPEGDGTGFVRLFCRIRD